jgi:hypothetical protein
MKPATEYRHIRAWGRMMGSRDYYIQDQIEQARKDKAPQDAIYRTSEGRWRVFSDVTRPDTRSTIESILGQR